MKASKRIIRMSLLAVMSPLGFVAGAADDAGEAKDPYAHLAYNHTRETARHSPDWIRHGVIYQIQPRSFTAEGTLKAAEAKLPWVKEIGATVVYLWPVFVADEDPRRHLWGVNSPEGLKNPRSPYRTKDYFNVDPEYGTKEDLKSFVKTAHELGLRVLFDSVFTHAGPNVVFLKEHPEWFAHDEKTGKPVLTYWKTPKLNFESTGLRRYFKTMLAYWIIETGADGYRCDVSDTIPLDFWEDARRELETIRPDVVLLAEGWRKANSRYTFDCGYNWPVCGEIRNALGMGHNCKIPKEPLADKIRQGWERHYGDFVRNTYDMNFLTNHDQAHHEGTNRAEKVLGADNQALGLALIFTMKGTPLIYNGQEICDQTRHFLWGHSGSINWAEATTDKAKKRVKLVQELSRLRRTNRALREGEMVWLDNNQPKQVCSFLRRAEFAKDVVFVGNFSAESVTVKVEGVPSNREPILSHLGEIKGDTVELAPWGWVICE